MSVQQSNRNRRLKSALAKSLIVVAFMNLNGLAYMLLGIKQVFSLGLLACTVMLIILHRRIFLSVEFVLYLLLIFGYILFGILFIPVFNDPQAMIGDLPTLAGTILLTVAIVQHIQNFKEYRDYLDFFCFARNVALVAAIANLFSGFLYPLYVNAPPSADYRSAGLFANPNSAGLMAVLAVALVILFPIRARTLNFLAIGLASIAAIITFSRAAILTLVIVLLISVWKTGSWKRLILVPVIFVSSMAILFYASDVVGWLSSQSLLELDRQQLKRLQTIFLILDGQIDSETAGGRDELLIFAFNKAISVFPLGTGLHSFQALDGGLRGGYGQWLGSHNSFVMVWGESGFLMLLVLFSFCLAVLVRSARSGHWESGMFPLLVFLGGAMFSHEVFSLRFINVVTAFMIAQSWVVYRLWPNAQPSSIRTLRRSSR